MNTLVATKHTFISMEAFAAALLEVWPDATKEQSAVLYAQFAGETGASKYLWNNNFGNVKWSKGCGLDYMSLAGVWEGFLVRDEDKDGDIDDDDRAMLVARMVASGLWAVDTSKDHAIAVGKAKVSLIATPANTTTWFRAYPSAAAGMAAFVKTKQSGRFASAWAFVVAGDCVGFARDIGIPRVRPGDTWPTVYYTADVTAYANAMLAHRARWMASTAFDEALEARREPSVVTPEQLLDEPAIVHPRLDLTPPPRPID